MCRFLVYKGSDEILLSKLVLDPSHSILTQSFDARLRLDLRRPINADGFGIGYYTDPKLGPEPCIFTSTIPAWNCVNLQRIASKTASSLIFAHIRATSDGSLSDDNCHPFRHGSLMFMHNGNLGGWIHIKRPLGESLADKWYLGVQGNSDSQWAFALFLDSLERLGYNPSITPEGGFGPNVLRAATLKTIQRINDLIANISRRVIEEEKVDTRSLLNFATTDGHSVVCSRYVSSRTDEAASLFYSSGTTWHDKRKGNFQMDRRDKGADIVLVASEPLTFERDNWVTVPTNSILTIHKQTVMIHPIIDEYYNNDPYHSRSSQFAAEKGLVSNGSGATPQAVSPMQTPGLLLEHTKKYSPQSKVPESLFRSLSPESHSPLVIRNMPSDSSLKTYSENGSVLDIRRVTPLTVRDPARPQEQGNTKKKRRSMVQVEPLLQAEPEAEDTERSSTLPERTAYGDPTKIARFFPELNLS